jgi:hypothetical protein
VLLLLLLLQLSNQVVLLPQLCLQLLVLVPQRVHAGHQHLPHDSDVLFQQRPRCRAHVIRLLLLLLLLLLRWRRQRQRQQQRLLWVLLLWLLLRAGRLLTRSVGVVVLLLLVLRAL